jgi:hypothetical protein
MAVVFHHMGRPRNATTAQKENMTHRRNHKLSLVSGGGGLLFLDAGIDEGVFAATPAPSLGAEDMTAALLEL